MLKVFNIELHKEMGLYNLSQVERILRYKQIKCQEVSSWLKDKSWEEKYGDLFVSGILIELYLIDIGQSNALYKPFEIPFYIGLWIKMSSWLEEKIKKIKG